MGIVRYDFMLSTEMAKKLYYDYAEKMPIIDYHCHLNPKDIAEDRTFDNITQLWLEGDHYKWRLMRNCGIEEKYITGDGSDREKFIKWAETLERCPGNPVYHWCMLELARYFEFDQYLGSRNAGGAWEHCNRVIREKRLSAKGIIAASGVKLLCTTDNPEDDLIWHKRIAEDKSFTVKVLPAYRPDWVMKLKEANFAARLQQLESRFSMIAEDYEGLLRILRASIEYFQSMGCCTSDHGLDKIPFILSNRAEVDLIFQKARSGEAITECEEEIYQTRLLIDLAREYKQKGWVMQLHYGARRNNNTEMFFKMGSDMGYDSISGEKAGINLPTFLDELEKKHMLPKTILYSLDPADNIFLDTVCGCYTEEGVKSKVQHGSAWWFNDNRKGMREHLEGLANNGVLGNFVGMLTDSRSLLSYTRHEYFRRILCDLLGEWVEVGYHPNNEEVLGKIVEDISYYNALEFFDLKKQIGGEV